MRAGHQFYLIQVLLARAIDNLFGIQPLASALRPNWEFTASALNVSFRGEVSESVQESGYLVSRLAMSLIIAVWMKAKLVVENRSKSFDRRRFMPSHASVRSTSQRFGST